jgi:hypothetical protein
MAKARRYKRVRHRRVVRPVKQLGDEKVFGEITPEEFFSEVERAATAAGVAPEWIYAMKKTGILLTEANEDQFSKKELAEWDAAIEEYRSRKPGSSHADACRKLMVLAHLIRHS